MNAFVVFLIFIFVIYILPRMVKNSAEKPRSTKPPAKPRQKTQNTPWHLDQAEIKRKMREFTDKHGHSGARRQTHRDLHRNDNADVFPENHAQRERMRDRKDRLNRAQMERASHSSKNRGVIRAQNHGRDDWGARGDRGFTSSQVVLTIILLLILVASLISNVPEDAFSGFKI